MDRDGEGHPAGRIKRQKGGQTAREMARFVGETGDGTGDSGSLAVGPPLSPLKGLNKVTKKPILVLTR